jgi:hypothetical protein
VTKTIPMGFRIDPELSIVDNARAAWSNQSDLRRRDGERGLRDALRRVLKTNPDEMEIRFLEPGQVVATVEIDDELIAFDDGHLAVVEMCGDCGEAWRFWGFHSLTGLGEVLAKREDAPHFKCENCRHQDIGVKLKRRK